MRGNWNDVRLGNRIRIVSPFLTTRIAYNRTLLEYAVQSTSGVRSLITEPFIGVQTRPVRSVRMAPLEYTRRSESQARYTQTP